MPLISIKMTGDEGLALSLLNLITDVPEDILAIVILLETQLESRGVDFNGNAFIESIRVQMKENSK